jgi:uncharacterized protein (TIGR00297 family)
MSTEQQALRAQPILKAIPPTRDRLQSRLLVWISVPILCWLAVDSLRKVVGLTGGFIGPTGRYEHHLPTSIAASLLFALAAWRLRAATAGAAACGGLICMLLTQFTHSWGSSIAASALSPLLLLFVLTYTATLQGAKQKQVADAAEPCIGRTASQVIANLGVAGFFASLQGMGLANSAGAPSSWQGENPAFVAAYFIPLMAALAEATADTVSSEIGQAYGGRPILITTFRRVPAGTDGAITLRGTMAGVGAAAIVVLSAIPSLGMSIRQCVLVLLCGIGALFFDSVLGATAERKGWLGNDLVNFFSTAFAAALGLAGIHLFLDWLFP